MKRNKSILRRLLPWLIGIAALAALILFVFVPIYSPREVNFGRESHVVNYDGDGKPIVLENDALKFEMDGGTSQFTVTNKANGQVWYSNATDAENDPIAGGVNKEFLSSTVTITYTHATKGTEIIIPYEPGGKSYTVGGAYRYTTHSASGGFTLNGKTISNSD